MALNALIVEDPQKSFCKGGSLEVPGADEIIPLINKLMEESKYSDFTAITFVVVVGTQDWHPENHISFRPVDKGGAGWPIHSVIGSEGAEFHRDLKTDFFNVIIRKATNPEKEAYSSFKDTGLAGLLKELGVTDVYICGLALDFCVGETALDAAENGFKTFVLIDATRAVSENGKNEMLKRFEEKGVTVIGTEDLKKL